MLVLRARTGDAITIGDVTVRITTAKGTLVKVAIEAAADIPINHHRRNWRPIDQAAKDARTEKPTSEARRIYERIAADTAAKEPRE